MTVPGLLRSLRETAVDRGRSIGIGNGSADVSDTDTPADSPTTGLYQCQACDAVYVAVEKDRCHECDATVEAVPASFSTV